MLFSNKSDSDCEGDLLYNFKDISFSVFKNVSNSIFGSFLFYLQKIKSKVIGSMFMLASWHNLWNLLDFNKLRFVRSPNDV